VPADLASFIDHTLLAPDARAADVERLSDEARVHGFAAVCVNGVHVEVCAERLRGSGVAVASVVGFPLGAMHPEAKVAEASLALENGPTELDLVQQIGALLAGDDELVARDIRGVCEAAHARGALVKVILETALLTDDDKIRACELARNAGADFVKTSTGFSGAGATAEDVALLARTVGDALGVKASGGIRTAADARCMIAAGATRIGTSNGLALVAD